MYTNSPLSSCFFHFGQSIYRQIQSAGLQAEYNDPDDRSLKVYTHMMLALAFVPLAEVPRIFSLLKKDESEDLLSIFEYFEKNYVFGVIARGRRRGILPRYPPEIWNQHQAALTGSHNTKNVSEGWHNRIQLVLENIIPNFTLLSMSSKKNKPM